MGDAVPIGELILLVDDVPGFRDDAAAALRRAGYRVTAVATTTAALDRLDRGLAVDVLVTRVRMPAGHPHGLALARMVKLRRPDVRVLLHAVALDDLPEVEREDPPGLLMRRPTRGADLVRALDTAFGGDPGGLEAPPAKRRSGVGC
jgi:CheY-like chemotaxis protein